jgi:hypothetical protein
MKKERKMEQPKIKYLITDHNISVFYNDEVHLVSRDDENANKLIEALKGHDYVVVPKYLSAAKRVEDLGKGNFEVVDGKIFINGNESPPVLGEKIVKFANEGLPYQPLVRFFENIQMNPSIRATNELFIYLEKNQFIITDSGCFIAYKRVRHDYMDIYSGTFSNKPGESPTIQFGEVEDDSSKTCARGLHVASWDYAKHHYSHATNDKMLEVEVNPKNVVAIPSDYSFQKMRVCQYKVLRVVEEEIEEKHYKKTDQIADETDDMIDMN